MLKKLPLMSSRFKSKLTFCTYLHHSKTCRFVNDWIFVNLWSPEDDQNCYWCVMVVCKHVLFFDLNSFSFFPSNGDQKPCIGFLWNKGSDDHGPKRVYPSDFGDIFLLMPTPMKIYFCQTLFGLKIILTFKMKISALVPAFSTSSGKHKCQYCNLQSFGYLSSTIIRPLNRYSPVKLKLSPVCWAGIWVCSKCTGTIIQGLYPQSLACTYDSLFHIAAEL